MNKGFAEKILEVLRPQAPLWACELTAKHVIVAGVSGNRTQIAGKVALERPSGQGTAAAGPAVQDALKQAGFKGSEIAVVVPDETARIAFLTADKASKNVEEQQAFIRWKLKKTIPFDVDTAQVAYRVLGSHRSGTGVDLLVALSPRATVLEYETLFDAMDIHAGMVLPSTLAALNLFDPPVRDALFLKIAPDCVTTTVFQNRRIEFYRRITDLALYDSVYPTILYYQDKLGGKGLDQLYVCGYDSDHREALDEVQQKLGLAVQRLEPRTVGDMYKPALGAMHVKPEGVL